MPSVVFGMLRDLRLSPGQRALEIGTGTGWNAGLLAHRTGAHNVVTVEVDGAVARHARAALERLKLRAQRLPAVVHTAYVGGSVAEHDESSTALTEGAFLGGRFSPQAFALGLRVSDCVQVVAEKREGARPVWFYGLTDRPWACVLFRDGAVARVWQSGDRRLWDEVEAAFRWWDAEGQPGHERFGLTVTAHEQFAWLDDPKRRVAHS
jgi:SAM-dependent methyltransferase